MSWNWHAKTKDIIFMDFETQSVVDIRKEGGRRYIEDPSTRISIASFMDAQRKTCWVIPGRTPTGIVVPAGWELHLDPEPPPWIYDGRTLCAHNAGEFDKHVWDKLVGTDVPWIDSMPICRAAGLPGSLDKTSFSLFGERKDGRGYALINLLCKAKVFGGEIQYPMATAAAWSAFIEYCCRDVELLARLFPMVEQYADPDMLAVSQTVNDRGVPIDTEFAARLVTLQSMVKIYRGKEFEELTGFEATGKGSQKAIMNWLSSIGVRLPEKNGKPSLDKKELNRLFKEPDAFVDGPNEELSGAIAALQARMEMTRATAGKAEAALTHVSSDGRARGQVIANGAHTGRYSGKGFQPHNMPRPAKGVNPWEHCDPNLGFDQIIHIANKATEIQRQTDPDAECTISDVISSLIRPMLRSHTHFGVSDYAAVEARGVAIVCDQADAIAEFRKPDADPYIPLASRIFGRPITKADETERWIGKAAILGCGYGMSWKKFVLYCAMQKVDLEKRGVDPKRVVDMYRESHPKIAAGWKLVHEAALRAAEGQEVVACRCTFYRDQNDMHIVLPSGRHIVYRNTRIKMMVPAYAALFGFRCDPVPTVVYDHPHGYEGMLYGGKTMENIVQALCRDLLVDALVRVEAAGLNPVLHVHDEIITEGTDTGELCRLMSIPPAWCPDFPITVEGYQYPRYLKAAPKSAPHFRAIGGVLL